MSDPPRIRDAGTDVPEELRELFRAAERPEPLTPAAQASLSGRIAAIAAAPAPLLIRLLPWLLGTVTITAGAIALRSSVDAELRTTPPAEAPKPVIQPPFASAPAPVMSSPPSATAAGPRKEGNAATEPHGLQPHAETRIAAAPSAGAVPSAATDALRGEAELLSKAQRALATDPRKALATAREHARRYPRGQLAAERELLLVQALVKLGRRSEADDHGRQLRKNAPDSIYEERLDRVLREK